MTPVVAKRRIVETIAEVRVRQHMCNNVQGIAVIDFVLLRHPRTEIRVILTGNIAVIVVKSDTGGLPGQISNLDPIDGFAHVLEIRKRCVCQSVSRAKKGIGVGEEFVSQSLRYSCFTVDEIGDLKMRLAEERRPVRAVCRWWAVTASGRGGVSFQKDTSAIARLGYLNRIAGPKKGVPLCHAR